MPCNYTTLTSPSPGNVSQGESDGSASGFNAASAAPGAVEHIDSNRGAVTTDVPSTSVGGDFLPMPEGIRFLNQSQLGASDLPCLEPVPAEQIHDQSSSNCELYCPIDAEAIRNRWLNVYLPVPGQKFKKYSPSINAFIYRILKAYAAVVTHNRGVPPFVHASQLKSDSTSRPLATCLMLARICEKPVPGSEGAAIDVLQREMSNLLEKHDSHDEQGSLATFQAYLVYISGFASNIYFPAIPSIARDLNVSVELINLTVTSYLIFQGLAPSLWGPISDAWGRRVAYIGTFLVFFGACIGLALSSNYAALVVLRCLQSTGSASTIAIGSGVIGDITTRDERGGYMGVFQAGLLAPVAIGPVIGGALAGSLGWRSVFWFLSIYSGAFLLLLVLFLPETLRSIVGNGSRRPTGAMTRYPLVLYQKRKQQLVESIRPDTPRTKKGIDIAGPFWILFSRQAFPIIAFLAVYYAVWQMSITAMSSLFESRYGLSETAIGLTFIANGVGSITGTLFTGKILDLDYRKVKEAHEAQALDSLVEGRTVDFPLERARLRLVPVFALTQCASILVYGWTISYPQRVHIAIPIASTFITGCTAVSTQSIVMTYIVDVFSDRSAAASASLNLARCLFAAGGTSFVMPMVNGIGVGITFTICVIAQVVALSGVAVQWRFATAWRKADMERIQREALT
ncbi:hypothetical protein E8E12_002104 [Didymella heteroderae]|uniref:Major facilitator superfamily (MFS) profile domain-containing protein n=1 Tax=Didymella heteroderae TaxID=1769908 RepID=A0A9P4WHH6_9PLEO|nr:hypothetical protein E8E12_002104 [Didymella heteroderae]